MARTAWGLDIGQTSIRAVKLSGTGGTKAEMVDFYEAKLDTVIDDPSYEQKLLEALQDFVKHKRPGKTKLYASIPASNALFRVINVPMLGTGKLREIISYEARQQIPYPLEDVVWDYHTMSIDPATKEAEIALICIRKDEANRLLRIFDDANLTCSGLQVSSLALTNFLIREIPPQGPALYLDIGGRATDFIIYNEGSIWLRSLPVSGSDLTHALMDKFKVTAHEAENLKISLATSDEQQAERILRVLEPVAENMCNEVKRSLGVYKTQFRGVQFTEAVCMGNTFKLIGLDQAIADILNMGVNTPGVPQSIDKNPSVSLEELSDNRFVLGVATGLALQAIGLSEMSALLLPEDRRKALLIDSKFNYALVCVALLAFWVLSEGFFTKDKSEPYKNYQRDVKTLRDSIESRKKEWDAELAAAKPYIDRNNSLSSVGSQRGALQAAHAAVLHVLEQHNTERAGANRQQSWQSNPDAKSYRDWTRDRDIIRNLLEKEYPIVEITDEHGIKKEDPRIAATRRQSEESLNMQADQIAQMIHSRNGLAYLRSIDMKTDKITLYVDADGKRSLNQPDRAENPVSASSDDSASSQQQSADNIKEEREGLWVTVSGYVPAQATGTETGEILKLIEELKKLKYVYTDKEDSMHLNVTAPKNTIMLPSLSVPKARTPQQAVDDLETERASLGAVLSYEPWAGETVIGFTMKFAYILDDWQKSSEEEQQQ